MTTDGAVLPRVPDATRLAVDRTRLAHDRTLMAWVRTATSLISFGITIYKFFDFLHGGGAASSDRGGLSPRHFAMWLIGTGVVILSLAIWDHRRALRLLRTEYGALVPYSLATALALVVAAAGAVGLVLVALRQ